jgi:hypothetical protein
VQKTWHAASSALGCVPSRNWHQTKNVLWRFTKIHTNPSASSGFTCQRIVFQTQWSPLNVFSQENLPKNECYANILHSCIFLLLDYEFQNIIRMVFLTWTCFFLSNIKYGNQCIIVYSRCQLDKNWFQFFQHALTMELLWRYLANGTRFLCHQCTLSQAVCFIHSRSEKGEVLWWLHVQFLHNTSRMLSLMVTHKCLGQTVFSMPTASTKQTQKTSVSSKETSDGVDSVTFRSYNIRGINTSQFEQGLLPWQITFTVLIVLQ